MVDLSALSIGLTAAGRALDFFNGRAQSPIHAIAPPDHFQANAILDTLRALAGQVGPKQLHQPSDFGGRPLPVVRRESIEGQGGDTHFDRCLDCAANGSRSRLMPGQPGQPAHRRPAAIAIHDDRDMYIA